MPGGISELGAVRTDVKLVKPVKFGTFLRQYTLSERGQKFGRMVRLGRDI